MYLYKYSTLSNFGKIRTLQTQMICFLVDASEAGAGNLEVVVRCSRTGIRIPNFLEASDRNGRFRIYFTPKPDCYRYEVEVAFNEDPVNGYKCMNTISYKHY